MFRWFVEKKANYEKGQIFPLVIAALAVLIIMAMITANLGKLAIFKTDVSNAADAGALAGASILSGWLLGAGLTSDTWCGTAVVTTARMIEIAVLGRDDIHIESFTADTEATDDSSADYQQFSDTLVGMIKLYLQHLLKFYEAYPLILEDSIMTWSNAKQTALRAAFQNSGVDERPSLNWKNYDLRGMGTYDSYVNTYLSQEANQTGFSRFMSHPISGYGNSLGEISPGVLSDLTEYSGYGWTQNADESFSGSYPGNVNGYTSYDNWVKVVVQGSILFPVEALSFSDYFGSGAVTALNAIVGIGSYCKYVGWMGGSGDDTVNDLKEVYGLGYLLAAIFAIVTAVVFNGMIESLPSGLKFQDDNETLYTTENPIVVEVTRYKKGENLGMWNFQYGDSGQVHARSAAHVCRHDASNNDSEDITIKPVLVESIKDIGNLFGAVTGSLTEVDWSNPFGIITLVQSAACMGLTFGYVANYLYCDMAEQDCTEDYLENVLKVWALSGSGLVALQYMAYRYLCSEDTDVALTPQDSDASDVSTSGVTSLDTSDWFMTELHLFETELYPGYIE
ncbi:MAG: hypothetical protein NTZ92_05840 [Candidatus Omnitrophica bacterium]|nr:hypothetical protein [Candidatus Omnitrophota bacterium]